MKNLKTYSEVKGERPFDWNEFLNKEIITTDEWEKALYLSGDWVTCACGSQCSVIPRDAGGVPIDPLLYSLGQTFDICIGDENRLAAKKTLSEIEERSAYLIKKLTKS